MPIRDGYPLHYPAPSQVQADRALMRMVMHNLLGNAWKFTSGRDDALIEFDDAGRGRPVCYLRARQTRRL